jgi:hypothetical protein
MDDVGDVGDVENTNRTESEDQNSEIEDAAGAGKVLVYAFEWDVPP